MRKVSLFRRVPAGNTAAAQMETSNQTFHKTFMGENTKLRGRNTTSFLGENKLARNYNQHRHQQQQQQQQNLS